MAKTEYLDIVDEADTVIGKDTRSAVHEGHHIHRGIHVFIINNRGEILIQQRAMTKDDRPGYYDASVGAQVLSGETYEQAAWRESYEELGIKSIKLEQITKYKSFSDRQREIRTLFTAYSDGPFEINKTEVAKVLFLPVEKIVDMVESRKVHFTTGFTISLTHYIKRKS
jgi:isopentenyl-diphosphate delta-isomerase